MKKEKKKNIIEIKNLTKIYNSKDEKKKFKALENINLNIKRGEIFALLGSNGTGKTTLISVICGLVSVTKGQVLIDNFDIVKDYKITRSKIGLVPQEIHLNPFITVWEHIKTSRGLYGKKKDIQYMEKVLVDLSIFNKKDQKVRALSGGMKRRVLIAKALMNEPEILFLDEPTAGVDVELRKDLWKVVEKLKKNGTTIILTTHYLEEAEKMADRIGLIQGGKISMIEGKEILMKKLEGKKMILFLENSIEKIPESLSEFDLEISENRKEIIYYYKTDGKTGIVKMMETVKSAGLSFYDVKTEEKNLEEIFINLIK